MPAKRAGKTMPANFAGGRAPCHCRAPLSNGAPRTGPKQRCKLLVKRADPLLTRRAMNQPQKLTARAVRPRPLSGRIAAPGDKSISHRALMFAALAVGETRIEGLLTGEDVLRTAAAMRALGAEVVQDGAVWRVAGRGIGGLVEPADVLDMGNSGTAAPAAVRGNAGEPRSVRRDDRRRQPAPPPPCAASPSRWPWCGAPLHRARRRPAAARHPGRGRRDADPLPRPPLPLRR